VSDGKRFEQAGLLSARSFFEQEIPLGESAAKFGAPRLEIAKLGFERGEFSGDELTDTAAGSAAAIAFAENVGELSDREADGERGANQANAAESFARKNTVAGSGTGRSGKKSAAFVEANGIAADAREPSEFAGIQGPNCGSVGAHGCRVRVGTGSKVKRVF
jgi:hypothetical protein